MSGHATEFDMLQQLIPELEAEGYDIYVHPNRQLLPDFFEDFMPDAIAVRSDKSIAIEVIRRSHDGERKMGKVANLFEGHDEWEFRVVWITPAGAVMALESQTVSLIRKRIEEIKELAKGRHFSSAFLLSWATLEAIGRILLPKQFERAQTPGRLVQVLASEGYITPSEADNLRQLVGKRNKFVHGELKTRINKSDVD
ncbi:MAG: hypothetical protein ACU83V_13785, partial [Gammaproteobacteria bacterium]